MRVVKLLDLSVNPDNVFKDEEENSKNQEDSDSSKSSVAGILDQSEWLSDRSMMWQAYAKVGQSHLNSFPKVLIVSGGGGRS